VGHAAPASILFQFTRGDRFVPGKAADALFAAANEPRRIEWYTASHALHHNKKATADRLKWLRAELGLPGEGA